MSVRKAHNSGRNHLRNVVDYYQQIGHEKAQSVIDSITSSYAAEGQASANPMLPGGTHAGVAAMPFGFPPGMAPPPGGMPFPPPAGGRGMPPFPFPPNGMPPFPPNGVLSLLRYLAAQLDHHPKACLSHLLLVCPSLHLLACHSWAALALALVWDSLHLECPYRTCHTIQDANRMAATGFSKDATHTRRSKRPLNIHHGLRQPKNQRHSL